MSIWHAIGRQLQNPSGLAGHLTGHLMRIVNHTPNVLAVDALDIGPRDTVLELGFGPGHAIKLMASLAPAGLIYGVDQSPVMLEQAKHRNRAAVWEGRVVLYQAGFERLPFPDASIDRILAVNVIYYWRDPARVLDEVRRVLRPNGRLSVYATDAATMRRWKFAAREPHRLYGAADLSSALQEGGFENRGINVTDVTVATGVRGLLATCTKSTAFRSEAQLVLRRKPNDNRVVNEVGPNISSATGRWP